MDLKERNVISAVRPAPAAVLEETTIVRFVNSAMMSASDAAAELLKDAIDQYPTTSAVPINDSANSTNTCPDIKEWMELPMSKLRFSLSGVFLTIVCLLGAFSNLAAFVILFSSTKFSQSVYIYMKCLALNDCIMLTSLLFFSSYSLVFLPSTSPEVFLTATNAFLAIFPFWFAIVLMCQGQSIWLMSLITLDRCFALSSNFKIREAVCRKRVAITLSSISFFLWLSFGIVNVFIHSSAPWCVFPELDDKKQLFLLRTPFAADSWLFRVSFAIVMKFILPVVLTVVCISYSTFILIHTISASSSPGPTRINSVVQRRSTRESSSIKKRSKSARMPPSGGLVETDWHNEKSRRHSENGAAAPMLSPPNHPNLQSQESKVFGRGLRSRIQTAHALSWAIATSMIFCHLPASTVLLMGELSPVPLQGETWYLVSNEIANVLISSSSAINFLLFFLSGAKYRAEMNRLVEKLKRKFIKNKTPLVRHRCFNYDAPGTHPPETTARRLHIEEVTPKQPDNDNNKVKEVTIVVVNSPPQESDPPQGSIELEMSLKLAAASD